jgi:hypothetical protein
LVPWGDYVDLSPRWAPRLKMCRAFAEVVNKRGGKVENLELPKLGIRGNSLMLMQGIPGTPYLILDSLEWEEEPSEMVRLVRVVAPGIPLHITQRGNRRQETFFCKVNGVRSGHMDSAAKPSWLDLWKNKSRLEALHCISIVSGYISDLSKNYIFQKTGGFAAESVVGDKPGFFMFAR